MLPEEVFGVFGPGGGFRRILAMQRLAEVPEVLGTMPPIDDLSALATKCRGHFVPDPLRAVTQDHHRAQDRFVSTTICGVPAPADDIQCATAAGFGAQSTRKWRSLLARGHVAGCFKMGIRPSARP